MCMRTVTEALQHAPFVRVSPVEGWLYCCRLPWSEASPEGRHHVVRGPTCQESQDLFQCPQAASPDQTPAGGALSPSDGPSTNSPGRASSAYLAESPVRVLEVSDDSLAECDCAAAPGADPTTPQTGSAERCHADVNAEDTAGPGSDRHKDAKHRGRARDGTCGEAYLFQKARATRFLSWDALLSIDIPGGRGLLSNKVLVVKQPVPMETARQLLAAGAEAVVMPRTLIGDEERCHAFSCLYASLAQGRGAGLAVVDANADCGRQVLTCVL